VLERDVAFFDVAELPKSLTQSLKVRGFFFDVRARRARARKKFADLVEFAFFTGVRLSEPLD
jgi:hypothetical protein